MARSKDPVYENVVTGTESKYQDCFESILNEIDVQNFTDQSLNRPHDKGKIKSDYEIVERIVKEAQNTDDLIPAVLQVMLEQFFFADVYKRENDKKKWIEVVMNRKDEDYFPDSESIYLNLFD